MTWPGAAVSVAEVLANAAVETVKVGAQIYVNVAYYGIEGVVRCAEAWAGGRGSRRAEPMRVQGNDMRTFRAIQNSGEGGRQLEWIE